MKKIIAQVVCAAFILTGPGSSFIYAAGQKANVPQAGIKTGIVLPHAPSVINSGVAIGAGVVITPAQQAKAQAAGIPTIQQVGEVVKTVSEAGKAGSVEAGQAIDSLYIHGAKTTASGFAIDTGAEVTHESMLVRSDRSTSARSASPIDSQRGGSSMILMGIGATAAVGGALYAFVPRIRDLVNYHVKRIYNSLRSAESVAKEIVDRLEKGKAEYNTMVVSTKTEMERLEGVLASQQKQYDAKMGEAKAKAKQAAGAAKDTPAYNAAYGEATDLMKQANRIKIQVDSSTQDVAKAHSAYKDAMEKRESFFNTEAQQLAAVQARMTDKKLVGDLNSTIARLETEYQIKSQEAVGTLTDKANEAVAKGKAAKDAVESSEAGGQIKADDQLHQRAAEDGVDQMIKDMQKGGKGGTSMLDATTTRYLRVATWIIGAGLVFTFPTLGVITVAGLGLLSIFLPPAAAQHLGGDVAVIGAGTAMLGLAIAKIGTMFGSSLAIVGIAGSFTFLAPAAVAVALGLLGGVKGYNALRAQAKAAPAQPAAAPAPIQMEAPRPVVFTTAKGETVAAPAIADVAKQAVEAGSKMAKAGAKAAEAAAKQTGAAAANAAEGVVKSADRLADQATQAADKLAQQPVPAAPSVGEIAKNAQEVGGKLADATGRIIVAGAQQADAAARQGADKVIAKLNEIAEKAQKAADNAEAGVAEQKAAEAGSPTANESLGAKLKRIVDVIMTIIGIKVDQQLTQLESSPEYQAYKLQQIMKNAEASFQQKVKTAGEAYYYIETVLEQKQAESAKLQGEVATLLSPKVSGAPASNKDVTAARAKFDKKRRVDSEILAGLVSMGEKKKMLEKAIADRALMFAENAEAMIAIKTGLSRSQLADLQAHLSSMEQAYMTNMAQVQEKFNEEVNKHVAVGRAAAASADSDPNVVLAEATQRASAQNADAAFAQLQQELAAKPQ